MKRLFLILLPYLITCSIFAVLLTLSTQHKEIKHIQNKIDSLSTDSVK